MMQHDYCEHAPQGYWGSASAELVGEAMAFHNDASIDQALRNLAVSFLCSPGHSSKLWHFPVIGCGIAIRKLRDGWVRIFVTIRLRY